MNGEEDFHVENTVETERSLCDICVLLLDSDDTCLMNLSEIMRKCGYRVVATTSADDVGLIINNKDEKIDLVLAEFRFIEMNKYEILEKIRSICEIPVVVMGAYVKYTIFDCLRRGAKYCLTKPLVESDLLENLWQFIVTKQRGFHSQIDTNPPEKKYSITQTQSLRDELNRTSKDKEVKTEELEECKDKLRQGKKRKEKTNTDTGEHTEKDHGCDLGDQKKPKLICADDLQSGAIPNIEEANNERKEPTESEKEKPELICMEEELEKWSSQPVTNFATFVEYEYEERDLQPLESVGECVGYDHEIPSSPQESSNKYIVGQLVMQKTQRALDEEDGISLADLEFDLQEEGHGSTSDLENEELFDGILTDLAKELKP